MSEGTLTMSEKPSLLVCTASSKSPVSIILGCAEFTEFRSGNFTAKFHRIEL